jgi:hypothetical protein
LSSTLADREVIGSIVDQCQQLWELCRCDPAQEEAYCEGQQQSAEDGTMGKHPKCLI